MIWKIKYFCQLCFCHSSYRGFFQIMWYTRRYASLAQWVFMKTWQIFPWEPWYPLRVKVSLIWYWKVHFQSSLVIYVVLSQLIQFFQLIRRLRNSVLERVLKVIFLHKFLSWGRNDGGFSRDINILSEAVSCVSGGIYHEEYSFCWACIFICFHFNSESFLKLL